MVLVFDLGIRVGISANCGGPGNKARAQVSLGHVGVMQTGTPRLAQNGIGMVEMGCLGWMPDNAA